MAKYEPKTRVSDASVDDFLSTIEDEQKRADSFTILEMFRKATKEEPKMWGSAIVGFGSQALKYPAGRELDWPKLAFSPRKANLVLYLTLDGYDQFDGLMNKIGKHSTGKSCLYIKRLSDIDMKVLKELINAAMKKIKAKK